MILDKRALEDIVDQAIEGNSPFIAFGRGCKKAYTRLLIYSLMLYRVQGLKWSDIWKMYDDMIARGGQGNADSTE